MTIETMSATEAEKLMEAIEHEERPPAAATAPAATVTAPGSVLREFVNPEQLKKDVEFDPNDLDNAVMSHASLFVHYSNLARLARRQFERMKAALEIMESRLDTEHRIAMKGDGAKVTEAQIAAAVKSDRRWWAAQNRLIDARAIYDLANDAREAFAQRKDMIVQISVDRRREREGQLRVMEHSSARDAMNAGASAAASGLPAAK